MATLSPELLKRHTKAFLIKIQNRDLQDLEELKQLKAQDISSIYLDHNLIQTTTWFDKFVNLSTLDLSHNEITTLAGLENCKKLKHLFLDNNLIEDTAELQHLKDMDLVDLSLFNNPFQQERCSRDTQLVLRQLCVKVLNFDGQFLVRPE